MRLCFGILENLVFLVFQNQFRIKVQFWLSFKSWPSHIENILREYGRIMVTMNLPNIKIMSIVQCFNTASIKLVKHSWSRVLFVFEIEDAMFFPVIQSFVALSRTLPWPPIKTKFLKIRGHVEHISLDHITYAQLLLIELDERSLSLFLRLRGNILSQLLGRFNHS